MADFYHEGGKADLARGTASIDGPELNMLEPDGYPSTSSNLPLDHFNSSEYSPTNLLYDGHGGAAQPVVYGSIAMAAVALIRYTSTFAPHARRVVTNWTHKVRTVASTYFNESEGKAAKDWIDTTFKRMEPMFNRDSVHREIAERFRDAAKAEIDYIVGQGKLVIQSEATRNTYGPRKRL